MYEQDLLWQFKQPASQVHVINKETIQTYSVSAAPGETKDEVTEDVSPNVFVSRTRLTTVSCSVFSTSSRNDMIVLNKDKRRINEETF